MKRVYKSTVRTCVATFMALMLLTPSFGWANNPEDTPSGGAMVADAVIARPLLLVATVLGTGLYVVSLPFSLAGGNAADAGQALVLEPAKNTFVRCLGCRKAGYQR